MNKTYIALGDLVLDIYYDSDNNLLGYYPGGSVWNDIINISRLQNDSLCYAIATAGNDIAGDFVIRTLNKYGIDTSHVIQSKKQTKRFNIKINGAKTQSQLRCPKCDCKIWYSDSRLPTDTPPSVSSDAPGVIIVDCLRENVLASAKSFKDRGWFIAADIGYISHLRYKTKLGASNLLCNRFDLLQLNSRAFKFIMKKFSCTSTIDLFEILNCRYLSLTDSENGSQFLYRDSENKIKIIHQDAIISKLVDPTGAGDAYFSILLSHLDKLDSSAICVKNILEKAALFASECVLCVVK